MAVTNNIREIREQRGIYQDDLASAIGYSTKTVGRIERKNIQIDRFCDKGMLFCNSPKISFFLITAGP